MADSSESSFTILDVWYICIFFLHTVACKKHPSVYRFWHFGNNSENSRLSNKRSCRGFPSSSWHSFLLDNTGGMILKCRSQVCSSHEYTSWCTFPLGNILTDIFLKNESIECEAVALFKGTKATYPWEQMNKIQKLIWVFLWKWQYHQI